MINSKIADRDSETILKRVQHKVQNDKCGAFAYPCHAEFISASPLESKGFESIGNFGINGRNNTLSNNLLIIINRKNEPETHREN